MLQKTHVCIAMKIQRKKALLLESTTFSSFVNYEDLNLIVMTKYNIIIKYQSVEE